MMDPKASTARSSPPHTRSSLIEATGGHVAHASCMETPGDAETDTRCVSMRMQDMQGCSSQAERAANMPSSTCPDWPAPSPVNSKGGTRSKHVGPMLGWPMQLGDKPSAPPACSRVASYGFAPGLTRLSPRFDWLMQNNVRGGDPMAAWRATQHRYCTER